MTYKQQHSEMATSEYVPMRVDIRVKFKDSSEMFAQGRIAPPPTPQQAPLSLSLASQEPPSSSSTSSSQEALLESAKDCNSSTPKEQSTPKLDRKRFIKLSLSSSSTASEKHSGDDMPCITIMSASLRHPQAKGSPGDEKPVTAIKISQPKMTRVIPRKQWLQETRNSRRNRIVVSPFSERRNLDYDSYCSACGECTDQTLLPNVVESGWFRGKPPLTPFTRLGCYRMQTPKARSMVKSAHTGTNEKKKLRTRCETAYVPPKAKQTALQRPVTHVPKVTKNNKGNTKEDVVTSYRSNNIIAIKDKTSHRQSKHKVIQDPCRDLEKTNLIGEEFLSKQPGLVRKWYKQRTSPPLQVQSQNENSSSHIPMTDESNLKQAEKTPRLTEDHSSKSRFKDAMIAYQRSIDKTLSSPFYRTLKINTHRTRWHAIPVSTSVTVFNR